MKATELVYKTCPHCGANILKTPPNQDGKCPYRFCENYGYNPMTMQDEALLSKYSGKSQFAVDLGDVVHCIDIVDNDKLVCVTIGYPSTMVISKSEFDTLMKTEYLFTNQASLEVEDNQSHHH